MIVEIAIPELTLYPDGFSFHWLNIVFLGNRPDDNKIHAISTTYVRLVEGAYVHYKNARQCVQAYWNNHTSVDRVSQPLRNLFRGLHQLDASGGIVHEANPQLPRGSSRPKEPVPHQACLLYTSPSPRD